MTTTTTTLTSAPEPVLSVSPVFNGQVIVSLQGSTTALTVEDARTLREALGASLYGVTVKPQPLPESVPHRAARGRTTDEQAYLDTKGGN